SVGAPPPPTGAPGLGALVHAQPVRSGQQVHAHGRDLAVVAAVGAGAEVIADGSLHVYGPLRGRALAGARGDTQARIFCTEFEAELVAIAGVFKVFEHMPENLRGRAVQVRLVDDQISVVPLSA
ncbi:MAG TPA: septum site-determining protein MinC, partial [Xanthomonadales bacterium]|nr:septum site-determining protein MinC [Xanthomonadales bacterium]